MIVAASCGTLGKGSCNSINEWDDFLIINNVTCSQNHDGTKAVTAVQLVPKTDRNGFPVEVN
jgi:hypothetical protein